MPVASGHAADLFRGSDCRGIINRGFPYIGQRPALPFAITHAHHLSTAKITGRPSDGRVFLYGNVDFDPAECPDITSGGLGDGAAGSADRPVLLTEKGGTFGRGGKNTSDRRLDTRFLQKKT